MTFAEGRDGLRLVNSSTPLRLLLIEAHDVELVLATLKEELPRADIWVETSLEAAKLRLASHRFDLVLVDLSLPDAQSALIARAVQATQPGAALIVHTGHLEGQMILWTLVEGMQDYLAKAQHLGPSLATAVLLALQRKRTEQSVDRYRQLAQGLLDASKAPTCAIDSGSRIVAVNRAWRDFGEQNGGTAESCGVGVSYLAICDHASRDPGALDFVEAGDVARGIRNVLDTSSDRFSRRYPCHSPGEARWFDVSVSSAMINEARGAVITHLDITDTIQMQQSMTHQSQHDPLTDLPNHALMLDRIAAATSDAKSLGRGLAVTQLDLHRYRDVNDRLGYAGGDALLVQVAARFQTHLRPGDTLARSSSGEFLVLWRNLHLPTPSEAVTLSEKLIRSLDRPFDVADVSVALSASAGVVCPNPEQSAEEILHSANAATHDAKRRGAGHVVLSTDELQQAERARRTLELELRQALQGPVTEFVVHYQPVVHLNSGTVVAVESLVRWQHPIRGLLGPDRFIPLAEAAGLIGQLGAWVLNQSLRDAARLTHQGRELDIAVNLSVLQLDSRIVTEVQAALEDSGTRSSRLILEVTESAFVEDEEAATSSLWALSQLGVKIAIDDFGTGYSSLLHLRRFPIDTLKIDRAFVSGIGDNAGDEAICASIVNLAAALGTSSVAEGVETREQGAALEALGCIQGQGYLWSPAVPIDEFGAALASCDQVPVATPQRPMLDPPETLSAESTAVIERMRTEGASLRTIAAALNRTLGPHPKGVHWTAGAVARRLAS